MSTSNPQSHYPVEEPKALEAAFAAASGAFDPNVIERMANDYLREGQSSGSFGNSAGVTTEHVTLLPTSSALPFSEVPAAPYNALPFGGAPSGYGSQAQFPATVPTLPSTLSVTELEAIPGTLTTTGSNPAAYASSRSVPTSAPTDISGLPVAAAFGFLADIRPLASLPNVPVSPTLPSVKIPTVTNVLAVEKGLPGLTTPNVPQSATSIAAPIAPGTVARTGDIGDPLSFAFVRDLRPLLSYEGVPSVEAIDAAPYGNSLNTMSSAGYDVNAIRRDFPILEERVNGRQIVWLDNAATTQKPQSVIDRLTYFYQHENSNVHRAAHTLAARSTDAYDAARDKVAQFLGASSAKDIIFVRGATEGINLIAQSWGRKNIQKDDEIVITWLEHHANIVPWQMLCAEKGAKLKVAPVDNDGQVLLDEYEKLLGPKTKLVSVTQVSNALGTITPVAEMVAAAHRYGAIALVDGAQAVSHMPIDVQALDCDFYVFSGHKVFAPTGIGVVYGKPEVLEHTPPWQGGGNMIVDVTFEKTTYHPPPGRFEAGTGNIADAIGLGAAIDYLNTIGMPNIARYEHDLLLYAIDALKTIPGLHLIGTAKEKASVLSFVLDGFRTEDVGTALNQEGIAVRSGHHCAQPILRRFGLESSVRPSLALYNTCEEVDKLVAAIWNLKQGRSASVV